MPVFAIGSSILLCDLKLTSKTGSHKRVLWYYTMKFHSRLVSNIELTYRVFKKCWLLYYNLILIIACSDLRLCTLVNLDILFCVIFTFQKVLKFKWCSYSEMKMIRYCTCNVEICERCQTTENDIYLRF